MLYKWTHKVYNILELAFFITHKPQEIHPSYWVYQEFIHFFQLGSISWLGYIIICLTFHLLKDDSVSFQFAATINNIVVCIYEQIFVNIRF